MTDLVRNEFCPSSTDASRALEGLTVKSKEDSEDAMPKVPIEEQLHNVHLGVRVQQQQQKQQQQQQQQGKL